MAAYGPAVARIRYLAGLSTHRADSPTTISGGDDAVYSYRLKIAWKTDDGRWQVIEPNSTPTTNRHIRAARIALDV